MRFVDRLLITRIFSVWAARRREVAARIGADADVLISEFGEEEGYFEAVTRSLPEDGGWPGGHWDKVARNIRRRIDQRDGKTPK
jgi:hypothetical protein